MRDQSLLHVRINRLAVNLQQGFEVFGGQHLRQSLEVRKYWCAMVHRVPRSDGCCPIASASQYAKSGTSRIIENACRVAPLFLKYSVQNWRRLSQYAGSFFAASIPRT